MHVFGAVLGAVLLAGFMRGTEYNPAPRVRGEPVARPSSDLRAAPSYTSMMTEPQARNTHWRHSLGGLVPQAAVDEAVTQGRNEAVAARAARRAFDGAPPTIPHPIDQRGVLGCLDCHAEGVVVAGRSAPAMSHAAYTNCTQCHVVADGPREPAAPPPQTVATENAFRPVPPPAFGERAWAGAPPTIPHSTQMRGTCLSCHGVSGAQGLKSSHPWRVSCTQCHAPGAALDLRPSMDVPLVGRTQ